PSRSARGIPGIVLDWAAVTSVARPLRAVSKSFRAHASTWARASLTARESGVCDITVPPCPCGPGSTAGYLDTLTHGALALLYAGSKPSAGATRDGDIGSPGQPSC